MKRLRASSYIRSSLFVLTLVVVTREAIAQSATVRVTDRDADFQRHELLASGVPAGRDRPDVRMAGPARMQGQRTSTFRPETIARRATAPAAIDASPTSADTTSPSDGVPRPVVGMGDHTFAFNALPAAEMDTRNRTNNDSVVTEAPVRAPAVSEPPIVATGVPIVAPESPSTAPVTTESPTLAPVATSQPPADSVEIRPPTTAPVTTAPPPVSPVAVEPPPSAVVPPPAPPEQSEAPTATQAPVETASPRMTSAPRPASVPSPSPIPPPSTLPAPAGTPGRHSDASPSSITGSSEDNDTSAFPSSSSNTDDPEQTPSIELDPNVSQPEDNNDLDPDLTSSEDDNPITSDENEPNVTRDETDPQVPPTLNRNEPDFDAVPELDTGEDDFDDPEDDFDLPADGSVDDINGFTLTPITSDMVSPEDGIETTDSDNSEAEPSHTSTLSAHSASLGGWKLALVIVGAVFAVLLSVFFVHRRHVRNAAANKRDRGSSQQRALDSFFRQNRVTVPRDTGASSNIYPADSFTPRDQIAMIMPPNAHEQSNVAAQVLNRRTRPGCTQGVPTPTNSYHGDMNDSYPGSLNAARLDSSITFGSRSVFLTTGSVAVSSAAPSGSFPTRAETVARMRTDASFAASTESVRENVRSSRSSGEYSIFSSSGVSVDSNPYRLSTQLFDVPAETPEPTNSYKSSRRFSDGVLSRLSDDENYSSQRAGSDSYRTEACTEDSYALTDSFASVDSTETESRSKV